VKTYQHIGVCPIHLGDRVIEPGTQRFQAEIAPELEAFLVKIEAIRELNPAKAVAKDKE
jgi:hypothetical protein